MSPARERATVALLLFYITCAFTLELYWLVERNRLSERRDLIARGYAFYGRGDRGYYDRVSAFETGLESFHICFTQPLHVLLLYGIARRALWRYPLQLGVSSYVCYSTALYLLANHLSGYAEMPHRDLASFMIFYVPNLPWLLGNAWLAWNAARAISRTFGEVEAAHAA
jgi:hypothetical protein